MFSNQDIWAIQSDPEEINNALSGLDESTKLKIVSNCFCNFLIGGKIIFEKQFNTAAICEELDMMILLRSGDDALKDLLIRILKKKSIRYSLKDCNHSTRSSKPDNIPEIWFAREAYVLKDAIKSSILKNVTKCVFFRNAKSELKLFDVCKKGKMEFVNIFSRGIVVFEDKIVLIISHGYSDNLSSDSVIGILGANGIEIEISDNMYPDVSIRHFGSMQSQ